VKSRPASTGSTYGPISLSLSQFATGTDVKELL
jgi:hypothetical protein